MIIKAQHRVAYAFDVDIEYATGVYRGIRDFCEDHPGWELFPIPVGFEDNLAGLLQSQSLDGLIGTFISDRWIESLGLTRQVLINVSSLSRINSVSTICTDDRAMGQLAGTTMLNLDLDYFAWVGLSGNYASNLRSHGLEESLNKVDFTLMRAPEGYDLDLDQWIESLPRPTGIVCFNDYLARRVITICRHKGLTIPEDVAVLGMGDSPMHSIFAGMGISSIPLPVNRIGYLAARQMQRELALLPHRNPELHMLDPEAAIFRQSTARAGTQDSAVTQALNHMRMNLQYPVSIADIARYVGVSRRSLENRFSRALGKSPYQVFQELRCDLAKTLLQETDWTIRRIARRCSYEEQHHFSAAFTRWTGLSPRKWREGALDHD